MSRPELITLAERAAIALQEALANLAQELRREEELATDLGMIKLDKMATSIESLDETIEDVISEIQDMM